MLDSDSFVRKLSLVLKDKKFRYNFYPRNFEMFKNSDENLLEGSQHFVWYSKSYENVLEPILLLLFCYNGTKEEEVNHVFRSTIG